MRTQIVMPAVAVAGKSAELVVAAELAVVASDIVGSRGTNVAAELEAHQSIAANQEHGAGYAVLRTTSSCHLGCSQGCCVI